MIRLTIAREPQTFQKEVREPGENVLALLEGKPLPHKLPGRKPSATKKVAGKDVPKKVEDFPYWTACLDDLHAAYHGICAYYCFYVHRACLPHVDHFVAKQDVGKLAAYEWNNYRLACGYANTCKREFPDVLDPAEIEDGWFQLADLVSLAVRPDPTLPNELKAKVTATIQRLKLQTGRALEVRQRAMDHFRSGRVGLDFLALDHPFLAKELIRHGITAKEQLPSCPPEVLHRVEPELLANPAYNDSRS
jgi:hypothetical protein